MKLFSRSEGCPLCPVSFWTLDAVQDLGLLMLEHMKMMHADAAGANQMKRMLETNVYMRRN